MQQLYLCCKILGFSAIDEALDLPEALHVGRYYSDIEPVAVTREVDADGVASTVVRVIFSAEDGALVNESWSRLKRFGQGVAARLGLARSGVKVYFAEGRWNVYAFNRQFGLDDWGE
jgi:hypothetical protein